VVVEPFLIIKCHAIGICAKRATHITKNDNAAACWCSLKYLIFFWPAGDGTESAVPWVVCWSRSYVILWAYSSSWLCEEGLAKSSLQASKRLKRSHDACRRLLGEQSAKHRFPKSANPISWIVTSLNPLEKGVSPLPRKKLQCGGMEI
jgi:hypothetical protein